MKRMLVVVLVVASFLGSACSVSPGDKVTVTMKEWSISVDPGEVRAGRVRLEIDSIGTERHDLALILGTRVESLPRTPDGKLDVAANRPIDEIEAFDPGHFTATSPNLLAGKYLLVCTLTSVVDGQTVDHLARGMWTKLTVVPRGKQAE